MMTGSVPSAAGDEIARAGNLAVVPDEDPAAAEDALQLVVEDARVGVERGVDAVVLHERLVVDRRWRTRATTFRLLYHLARRRSGRQERHREIDEQYRASRPP